MQITRNKISQMKDIAHCSKWSPAAADGRNQLERIATIYTEILLKYQQISRATERGYQQIAIASPQICLLIERITDLKPIPSTFNPDEPDIIHKVGTFKNDTITLYRDISVEEDYILLAEHLDDVVDKDSYRLIEVTGFSRPEQQVVCKDCGKWNIWKTVDGCFWLEPRLYMMDKEPEPQKCSCGTELKESDVKLIKGEIEECK